MILSRDESKSLSVAIVIDKNEKSFIDATLKVSVYSNDNVTLIRQFEEKTLKIMKCKYGEQVFIHRNFMTHSILQQFYQPQNNDNATVNIVCKVTITHIYS